MWAALQQLHILALGFAVMLGFIGPSDAVRRLARMALLALLLPFGVSVMRDFWAGLSTGMQLVVLVTGPPLALLCLMGSTEFGRNTLAQFLGTLMHTIVIGATRLVFRLAKTAVLAPFRLIRWLVRALRR